METASRSRDTRPTDSRKKSGQRRDRARGQKSRPDLELSHPKATVPWLLCLALYQQARFEVVETASYLTGV